MPKTLTPAQAQTQWDEQITELTERSQHARDYAEKVEYWARRAINARWFLIGACLFGHAAEQRLDVLEWTRTAERMRTCPHNPRNGGTGHKPAQTFWEFVQEVGLREIIDTLAWALGMFALAAIAGSLFIIAMIQNYPPGPDSLMPLVDVIGGVLTGVLAAIVTANTIRDIQSLGHFAWDYVWGGPL
jgi:hypothetical protein